MIFLTFSVGSLVLSGAANLLSKSARQIHLFDQVKSLGLADFSKDSLDKVNEIIEEYVRTNIGFGWWAWKPLLVEHELNKLKDGQMLLYLDAGCLFASDIIIKNAINFVESTKIEFDIIVQHADGYGVRKYGAEEFNWTKPETLKLLNDSNHAETPQWAASWMLIKKNSRTTKLTQEWRKVSFKDKFRFINLSLLDPSQPSQLIRHQHDQSILSICIKNSPNLLVDTPGIEILRQKLAGAIVVSRNRSPFKSVDRPKLDLLVQRFFYSLYLFETKMRRFRVYRKVNASYYRIRLCLSNRISV